MENALIIFVRNLEKGKVKNRLAKDIGDDKSLEVYKHLLQYTKDITVSCKCNLFVFYSHYVHMSDVFDDHLFSKHLQEGNDLGERMMNALKKVFNLGCGKVCIIGSDCYELQTEILNEAFEKLHQNDVVIGPSIDGGYYLLGMKKLFPDFFVNKDWGNSTVLDDTVENINQLGLTFSELDVLNDIDTIEDLLETNILTKLEEETQ
ncbi:MAG TPA: TIGR04282 family arsenosugar biosynthesis glycosyltransferase [Segetibacter sp.]|nr:TIGR04282 family arsenosugar biosynthesis glycosyltransferase [Segetibacter sp.]